MTVCRALLLTLAFAVTAPAQSPGSWRTFEHVETGLRFRYPGGFREIPIEPMERLIIGRFERDEALRARKRDTWRRPAELFVFALKGAVTGEKISDDPVERINAMHDARAFMKSRFPNFGMTKIDEDEKRSETIYRVNYPGTGEVEEMPKERFRTGILIVREVPGGTWGVLGFYDVEVASVFERDFKKLARGIEKPKGYAAVKDEGEEFYKTRGYLGFKDVPFRIEARRGLTRGWKPLDTTNFFVMLNTDNGAFVRKIANDLEAIRLLFEERFPPPKPIEGAAVVRICGNVGEYMEYGAPAGSAGYFNPLVKELVLYDASASVSDEGKRKQTVSDSYLVLYHEAFHQYVYFALGDFSPDYWFNEGVADYFGGTVIYASSSKVKEIGPNSWRLGFVKKLVERDDLFIPLADLIAAKRAQFYDPRKAGMMYAEAWSLIYFLIATPEGAANPLWPGIIDRYYAALIAEKAKRYDAIAATATNEQLAIAGDVVRAAATKTAFEGVDLQELEAAWKTWIREVKNPFDR